MPLGEELQTLWNYPLPFASILWNFNTMQLKFYLCCIILWFKNIKMFFYSHVNKDMPYKINNTRKIIPPQRLQVEEHFLDGKQRTLLVHRKGSTRAFPPHHPLIPVDYQVHHTREQDCDNWYIHNLFVRPSEIMVGPMTGGKLGYVISHLGQYEDWIVCVYLATTTCNVWRNMLSRICRSMECHFKSSGDTLIIICSIHRLTNWEWHCQVKNKFK